MEYDKQLEEYGILATNAKIDIKDNKITIVSTQIDEINFQTLQEKNIKEIYDAHIQSFIKTHTLCTFVFNIFILGVYLAILYFLISVEYLRRFFIGVSYVVVICILLISPKILIPAMGIFTDKRALLDPLSTLGGIYTIVFGFVLFSFIKTIRKNSIVPN